ncbi:phosphoketolase family protein [Schizosaccharomyces osmophilus]|uniref:Phosphoketolase family protein n=1 Tax=Schizosaccharomyces osmophilus TaxID=2545709 RepID=A0AAF0AXC0_9SCHI|nr:phosphoketolase family protein [Schizosaccharomyces osmophilus]WBW73729.1 phosphoketolase family protein [Schizosaccharomyces osmophilus]
MSGTSDIPNSSPEALAKQVEIAEKQSFPPSMPSRLPQEVSSLYVPLDSSKVSDEEVAAVDRFQRACDYLACSLIFLAKDIYTGGELNEDDVKTRLLGHWGTCPGLSIAYSHCNRIINKYDLDMIFVVGPGHGAPAVLGALFLEDSLGPFYPQYQFTRQGLKNLISTFSLPGGFPSHVNAECPGSIHEGGELGYSLSVSYGAVQDKPELIVTCVIGDGEAESGPLAGSWQTHKFLDPAESGAVIPILSLNGYKISERTIYGCMDDLELLALFSGFGYQVAIVNYTDEYNREMAAAMDWAVETIKDIQHRARVKRELIKPRWPMIILRSPKGKGCPKTLNGGFLEGTYHAHQVPLKLARNDPTQRKMLKEWLSSYRFDDFLDEEGLPTKGIRENIPQVNKRMGQRIETYNSYHPLTVTDWKKFGVAKGEKTSATYVVGNYLGELLRENNQTLRVFSPDELESNKLDAVLKYTDRTMQTDPTLMAKGGRVTEILSEHICQGLMQGYTLTGRTAIFPSYEAFMTIVVSMLIQYSKFIKMGLELPWHGKFGSLNYVTSSTWARQEHNGYSHQSPRFITTMLSFKPGISRVYFPADANCFLSTLARCMRSENTINLMVSSKNPQPSYLSIEEAEAHCTAGASVWKFCSTDNGINPDVVLVGIGNEIMFEVVKAAEMLANDIPSLRVRVVNVTDLMVLSSLHPHGMTQLEFDSLFTNNRHVHINYHGYVMDIKSLLFDRIEPSRVTLDGYREEGTTTTPFTMMMLNNTSRYDVARKALQHSTHNPYVSVNCHNLSANYSHKLDEIKDYIFKYKDDPPETFDVPDFKDKRTI